MSLKKALGTFFIAAGVVFHIFYFLISGVRLCAGGLPGIDSGSFRVLQGLEGQSAVGMTNYLFKKKLRVQR